MLPLIQLMKPDISCANGHPSIGLPLHHSGKESNLPFQPFPLHHPSHHPSHPPAPPPTPQARGRSPPPEIKMHPPSPPQLASLTMGRKKYLLAVEPDFRNLSLQPNFFSTSTFSFSPCSTEPEESRGEAARKPVSFAPSWIFRHSCYSCSLLARATNC
jgi:hypothetical protein